MPKGKLAPLRYCDLPEDTDSYLSFCVGVMALLWPTPGP